MVFSFRCLQNNKTLKLQHRTWNGNLCFRCLQNNKTLKQMLTPLTPNYRFRCLQNNKTLKRVSLRIWSSRCFRCLQNNKTLKRHITAELRLICFRCLQNNKTLKPQIIWRECRVSTIRLFHKHRFIQVLQGYFIIFHHNFQVFRTNLPSQQRLFPSKATVGFFGFLSKATPPAPDGNVRTRAKVAHPPTPSLSSQR